MGRTTVSNLRFGTLVHQRAERILDTSPSMTLAQAIKLAERDILRKFRLPRKQRRR